MDRIRMKQEQLRSLEIARNEVLQAADLAKAMDEGDEFMRLQLIARAIEERIDRVIVE